VAGNKKKKIKAKEEKETRMASPLRGDAISPAPLPPAREVNGDEVRNFGGMLARFERAFRRDPSSIPDLVEWMYLLQHAARNDGDGMDDRNAQRARRLLIDDVYDYLDEKGQLPEDWGE
jgi:hypothetical protein